MRKKIFIIFIILIVISFIKYFSSGYKTEYIVDDYNIKTNYSEGRYYIEIGDKYNFDIYKNRSLSKLKINSVKEITDDSLKCVYPVIKNVTTHPLCYLNGEYTDYNLIDSKYLEKYKTTHKNSELNDTFSYNKTLAKDEYIMLWNYKGFYKMNYKNNTSLNIFENDKYDNSLIYVVGNKMLIPNYDQEYIFNDFYVLNIETSKYKKIETKFEISYDSYIVGNIKNKVYLYDIKNSALYEINVNSLKVNLVCSEDMGYFKYENNKKVETTKKEYDEKKIIYENTEKSNYKYTLENNSIYKIINDNQSLKQKIYSAEAIKLINENENNLYFTVGDKLYKYSPYRGIDKVFNYFELNFNENDIIYLYVK